MANDLITNSVLTLDEPMSYKEWNLCIEILPMLAEGDDVVYAQRKVEIVSMCGGRYLLYEEGEVCGLAETVLGAMCFLKDGLFVDA